MIGSSLVHPLGTSTGGGRLVNHASRILQVMDRCGVLRRFGLTLRLRPGTP